MQDDLTNAFRTAQASRSLDPYSTLRPRFLGVVDTDALLSSIDNDCRNGWRSRLLRMTGAETASLYAADHVYGEVYSGLPKFARQGLTTADDLRTHFEERYLPVLRFVTVSTNQPHDPQVAAITDASDVPTGQLAKLIAPCVVFSGDKHLRKPGLAPQEWRQAAAAGADLAESYWMMAAVGGVIVLPGWAGVKLVKTVGRWIAVSPWLVASAVGAGAVWLLKNPERRKAAAKHLALAGEAVSVMVGEARHQELQGIKGLQEVLLPAVAEPSVKQQVAVVLARQGEPLLAREVQELMERHFRSDLVPTVSEVRSVLQENSEFVQPERYRWQFGREAGPWREERGADRRG